MTLFNYCDFDGVSNGQEVTNGTDPLVTISTLEANSFAVAMDNNLNRINIFTNSNIEGQYAIYNAVGQNVQSGALASSIPWAKSSMIVTLTSGAKDSSHHAKLFFYDYLIGLFEV